MVVVLQLLSKLFGLFLVDDDVVFDDYQSLSTHNTKWGLSRSRRILFFLVGQEVYYF